MNMQGRDLTLKNSDTKVQIRTLQKKDAGQLIKLITKIHHNNDLLELTHKEIEAIKTRKVRKTIKEFEKSKRQIMLGVFQENNLVGVCTISRVSERNKQSHRAALFIGLDEELRGKGLGAALMKMAFDFASKVAYEQFETTVLDGNTPAFILCTEYGFKAMCRFSRAFKNMKGSYQDSILLIKYLNNYEI